MAAPWGFVDFTKLLFALSSLALPLKRVRSIPEHFFVILSQRKACAGRYCAYLASSCTQSLVLHVLHRSMYALVLSSLDSKNERIKGPEKQLKQRLVDGAPSWKRRNGRSYVQWCVYLLRVCMPNLERVQPKLREGNVKNVKHRTKAIWHKYNA